MVLVPRAGPRLRIQRQGLAGGRIGIVKGEIIQEFLDTDGTRIRTAALLHHPAEIRIGRPVGIDGERGLRLLGDLHEGILDDFVEPVARGPGLFLALIPRKNK